MKRHSPPRRTRCSSEAGLTLIETAIALLVLFIASAGIMNIGVVAVVTTENQGHLAARTTEYAQDKIEQLVSLKYGDTSSDTFSENCIQYLVTPTCTSGGAGLTPGGTLSFTVPTNLYVDYLDASGNPLGSGATPPDNWFYMRVWEITVISPNLKRITVQCRVRSAVGNTQSRIIADSTLVSYKSYPF